jgi:hypothetical protein
LDPAGRILWRVGHVRDPIGFPPRVGYEFSHRFDDRERRWRTVYCAWTPETALREVLADLRPNAATLARFHRRYGPDAAVELTKEPITRAWRQRSVLAPVHIVVEPGVRVLDLTDAHEVRRLEAIHAELLVEHGMGRLDMHEITTRRREVTQAIATRAYDEENVGVVRYPSSIDLAGTPCYALIEGRARLALAGDLLLLTDPPPAPLEHVAAGWGMPLQPAPVLARRRARR